VCRLQNTLQIRSGAVKLKVGDGWRKSRDIAGETMAKARRSMEVFDQEFLPIRAKLLEVAASLDRLDRASGALTSESRITQVHAAIQVLLRPVSDRAEKIQLVFSRPFEDDWREKLGVREE
jgi:hypothetical protein